MLRYQEKLARIRRGEYQRSDFIIADAKDADMAAGVSACGLKRPADGSKSRYFTRQEFIDNMRQVIEQGEIDILLASASNLEILVNRGAFTESSVARAVRANDTTDIWGGIRGGRYVSHPSRPFRSADLERASAIADIGLYSITFNNDLDLDYASLEAFNTFRQDAAKAGLRYFLEIFNPNKDPGLLPNEVPAFVNDSIIRCLAGVMEADRPEFLKIVYNGPAALEELVAYDSSLVVGVLGGSAGTTRDCFELLFQAEKYGARVALFGRKINLAESPLDLIRLMRAVTNGDVTPTDAVKAYHGALANAGLSPIRSLEDDLAVTSSVLERAMS